MLKKISLNIVILLSMTHSSNTLSMKIYSSLKEQPILTTIGLTALAGSATVYAANNAYTQSLYWSWDTIDTTRINGVPLHEFFKKHACNLELKGSQWLWGAGTSAHQVEGNCTNNNWYDWCATEQAQSRGKLDAGIACDQWNNYKDDVRRLKEAGLNTYRFSVEWSKVMPTADSVDESALDHYEDLCKELVSNGIKPIITLFHYTEPIWFYKNDGFEKEENIQHFVTFCEKTFKRLHPYVELWLTFNSPSGHAMQGWQTGDKPPAKKGHTQLALEVFKNMLEAHVRVYRALKALPGGDASCIGILKNIFQLDSWNICNPLDHLACKIGNDMTNGSMYRFLTTGQFKVWVPGKASINYTNDYLSKGGKCLDFIGLNYYCHGYMSGFKTYRDTAREIPTDSPNYTIYGEGLYRAIKELSDNVACPCNVPIYVTENGIGTNNDANRDLFYHRYMYALARAIDAGYDVRGYVTWSFMDNYEWGDFTNRYGMYHVDFETQKRTLKAGAQYLVDLIKGSSIA